MDGQEFPNSYDNRQSGIVVNIITSVVIAVIFTVLRLITRIWIVRKVGWDDYIMIIATLGHLVGLVLVFLELHSGFGLHRESLSEETYVRFKRFSYAEWIQTFQSLMFTKLSVCFFLLRLPVDRRYVRPIQGTVVGLIISNVVLTFLFIFQCSPVPAALDERKRVSSRCLTDAQLLRVILAQALVSIISDFLLALFPIALLWKIQISRRTKAGLCSLMALGLITTALCIVRTVFNGQNINDDETWKSVTNWSYRTWEVSMGIIAGCIPAIRPGYRVVKNSISTYYALHYGTSRDGSTPESDESDETLVRRAGVGAEQNARDLQEKANLARELSRSSTNLKWGALGQGTTLSTDEHACKQQAIRSEYEDEGAEQGIRKTMWFGTEIGPEGSNQSLGDTTFERDGDGSAFV